MDKCLKRPNFDFLTAPKVLNPIAKIDSYKGKWNAIERQENRIKSISFTNFIA